MANAIFFARGRARNMIICALCIFAFLQGLRRIHYKVYKLFLSSCAYCRVAALIERCKKFFHFERAVASVCICRAKGGYKKFFHSKKMRAAIRALIVILNAPAANFHIPCAMSAMLSFAY